MWKRNHILLLLLFQCCSVLHRKKMRDVLKQIVIQKLVRDMVSKFTLSIQDICYYINISFNPDRDELSTK